MLCLLAVTEFGIDDDRALFENRDTTTAWSAGSDAALPIEWRNPVG